MENKEIIEVETEVQETVAEETKVSLPKRVWSGVKRNWKPIAIGTGAFIAGLMLGSRKGHEDYEDEEDYESDDETEVTENDIAE